MKPIINLVFVRLRSFRKKYIVDLPPEQERAMWSEFKDILVDITSESISKSIEKLKDDKNSGS